MPIWLVPLGRGFLLALPIAAIFAILFASADPIFGADDDRHPGLSARPRRAPGRVLFVGASAWLAAGLLSVVGGRGSRRSRGASLGRRCAARVAVPARDSGPPRPWSCLVVIDAVVGLFVGLQIAYLFGGQDTLVAAGMTYSDYARRGFFELVAAACLAGAVAVVLEATVARRSRPYIAALLGLLALTGVVLVSAALRLRLYQDAYGWTELRLYVARHDHRPGAPLALMAALAVTGRMRWLGHGLAVIGVVALVGLNLLAPAAFVAARNVERIIDPSLVAPGGHAGLDADYLGVLPDDAVPTLVAALPALPARDRPASWRSAGRQAELATDPAFASPAA